MKMKWNLNTTAENVNLKFVSLTTYHWNSSGNSRL